VVYYSNTHLEMRERLISAHELLTWAEAATVATADHPSRLLPAGTLPSGSPRCRLSIGERRIKDAIGKVRSYLSKRKSWEQSGKKKGKPGLPGAANHPTLYQGTLTLDLDTFKTQDRFAHLKVYTGSRWEWHNYPVQTSRYARATDQGSLLGI
jgi:hypothetical protein